MLAFASAIPSAISGPRALCALLVAGFVAVSAGTAHAQATADLDAHEVGPAVGAKILHDLAALDQEGKQRDFKALARTRGLLILFTRSVDW